MGHVPGLLSGPSSGPDSRTLTTQELQDLRRAAVRVALRSGASYEDAQDVAQNALLVLWSRAEYIDQRGGYVRRVAQREAWRLTRRPDQPFPPDELTFLAERGHANGKQIDDYLAEEDQVRGWISQLPPGQAEIITLLMDGFSLPEIADHLQIPRAVVRPRLTVAREKIRTAFVAQMTADRKAEQRPVTRRIKPQTRPPAATTSPAREETDLADLPPRQQEVLRLTRRGYKPAQIARVLAISPNTVRVNLFHARKRLRQATAAA